MLYERIFHFLSPALHGDSPAAQRAEETAEEVERAGNASSGFENEIQGVYREPHRDRTAPLYTYMVRK